VVNLQGNGKNVISIKINVLERFFAKNSKQNHGYKIKFPQEVST